MNKNENSKLRTLYINVILLNIKTREVKKDASNFKRNRIRVQNSRRKNLNAIILIFFVSFGQRK